MDWRHVLGALGVVGGGLGLVYYAARKDEEHRAELAERLAALQRREAEQQRTIILEGLRGMVHEEVQLAVDEAMADVHRRNEERERGRDLRAKVHEQERDRRAAAREDERDKRASAQETERERRVRDAELERERRGRAAEAERDRRARDAEVERASTAAGGWAQQYREMQRKIDEMVVEHERQFEELKARAQEMLSRPLPVLDGAPNTVSARIRKLHDDD